MRTKTAKSKAPKKTAPPVPVKFGDRDLAALLREGTWREIALGAIFAVMRILKRVNPGDAYYENYLSMRARYGATFFDTYELLWRLGTSARPPKRILEIGTRTGISLCQLLSAMSREAIDEIERVVCVDPFDEWTSPNLVRANLHYLNLPADGDSVKILAMKSEDYFKSAKETFDYILVDGDHDKGAARKDLDAAVKLIEKGGIIVFDDISTAPGECALLDVWEAWKAANAGAFHFAEDMGGKGVGWAIKA